MRGIGPQVGWKSYGGILENYNPPEGGRKNTPPALLALSGKFPESGPLQPISHNPIMISQKHLDLVFSNSYNLNRIN